MRKTSTIIVIWAIFILVTFVGFNCRFPEEKPASYNEKTIKKELNNLPKINIPPKSGSILKKLEANGYLKEETYVGMAEDRNNEVFNCTYNNTSIFLQTLSKYYYKNDTEKQLNKEFYEDCIKYKMHNPNIDTGGDKNDIEFYKRLNNNAVVFCYSDKDKYTKKTLNKREVIVKLRPDKTLKFSAIKFSDYNLNKKQQKEFFYKYIIKVQEDIKVLNKLFKDIKGE